MLVARSGQWAAAALYLTLTVLLAAPLSLTPHRTLFADDPDIELIGIPETTGSGEPMAEIAYDAVVDTFESLSKSRRRDPDAVAESIERAVRSAIGAQWGKKPMCHVLVLEV